MRHPDLEYSSPKQFSLKQKLLLFFAPPVVVALLRLIFLTCRFEVRGREHWERANNGYPNVWMGIWHETLIVSAYFHRRSGFHSLTSYSFDGELAARFARLLGVESLRGSTSSGGAAALIQLLKAAKKIKLLGFTLDGPRGPRREAKPGIALLSAMTQAPVLPQATAIDRAWRMRSWDNLAIPKPFSRITIAYGEPILPPPGKGSEETREALRSEIERALNALHREIEGGVLPGSSASP